MKRSDIAIVAALVGLLVALPYLDKLVFRKIWPAKPVPARVAPTNVPAAAARSAATAPVLSSVVSNRTDLSDRSDLSDAADTEPEQTAILHNKLLSLTISSKGASIANATLNQYRASLAKESGSVVLDFHDRRSLAYVGLPGFGEGQSFKVTVSDDGRTAHLERQVDNGLKLVRTMTLGEAYVVTVQDDLANTGSAPTNLAAYSMQLGIMSNQEPHHAKSPWVTIGLDSLASGGQGVQHWGNQLAKMFTKETEEKQLPKLPLTIDRAPSEAAPTWVAVKNKYFVQILAPEDGADSFRIWAQRQRDPAELANPDFRPKMQPLEAVSATVTYPDQVLAAGETFTRKMQVYLGPKKYSELHASQLHFVDVMEFGVWGPVGKVLLQVLNFLHDYLPPYNYGFAIMLLTIIIRVLFWPVTHKSQQSMKRMSALQPQIKVLQEKYKSDPQRLQKEMMALYKENKVNPLSSCLPMLIQIPVFISLFVVLRSAIELRFAPFLWIRDLSEPENLFAGLLPIPINLLPLLMAATMHLQMRMTPAAGDPAQQKIMMIMMPIMMLFFLYSYPAGLALYWTTQNILMIVQQAITLRQVQHPQAAKA